MTSAPEWHDRAVQPTTSSRKFGLNWDDVALQVVAAVVGAGDRVVHVGPVSAAFVGATALAVGPDGRVSVLGETDADLSSHLERIGVDRVVELTPADSVSSNLEGQGGSPIPAVVSIVYDDDLVRILPPLLNSWHKEQPVLLVSGVQATATWKQGERSWNLCDLVATADFRLFDSLGHELTNSDDWPAQGFAGSLDNFVAIAAESPRSADVVRILNRSFPEARSTSILDGMPRLRPPLGDLTTDRPTSAMLRDGDPLEPEVTRVTAGLPAPLAVPVAANEVDRRIDVMTSGAVVVDTIAGCVFVADDFQSSRFPMVGQSEPLTDLERLQVSFQGVQYPKSGKTALLELHWPRAQLAAVVFRHGNGVFEAAWHANGERQTFATTTQLGRGVDIILSKQDNGFAIDVLPSGGGWARTTFASDADGSMSIELGRSSHFGALGGIEGGCKVRVRCGANARQPERLVERRAGTAKSVGYRLGRRVVRRSPALRRVVRGLRSAQQ